MAAVVGAVAVAAIVVDDDPEPVVSGTDGVATASTSATTSTTDPGTTSGGPRGEQFYVSYPDGVLGVWDEGGWRPASVEDERGVVGAEFALVGLDGAVSRAVGEPDRPCELTGGSVRVGLPWPETTDRLTAPPVAVSGVADPRPRPVTVLDPESPAYAPVAAEIVASTIATDDDPRIVQLLRTDVEGDGTDEVFGVVERLSDTHSLFAQPGDYSIAFLRRVRPDGTVETSILDASFAADEEEVTPCVFLFRAAAFVDANGDGRMELALWSAQYEGTGMALYDVAAGHTPERVIETGCGA